MQPFILNAYYNGQYYTEGNLQVFPNDLGLYRSYAVFDYMRSYGTTLFRANDYISRFIQSAKDMYIPINETAEEILSICNALNETTSCPDIGIRLLLSGGYTNDGISPEKSNFFVLAERFTPLVEEQYTHGVALLTNEYMRYLPHVKTTHYAQAIRFRKQQKVNYYDVLYHVNGQVLETSRNNFFIFTGNTLITPCQHMLHGITRKVVLELAALHYNIEERAVSLEELFAADEVFLTGTTKKVLPVSSIDGKEIGKGKAGVRTLHLLELFDAYVASYHK